MRRGRYVALAVAAHLLLFAAPAVIVRKPLRRPEMVKLTIAEKPKTSVPLARVPPPAASRRVPQRAVAAPHAASSDAALPNAAQPDTAFPRQPPPPSTRVDGLLPDATYQYSFEDDAGQPRSSGPTPHAAIPTPLRITADQISGKLDIPLIFRQKNGVSKAVAKLVKTADTAFLFAYVDGDPYMRAVLFEALRAPEARDQVLRLFAALASREVLVVLNQTVVQGGAPTGETFENFAVSGTKLTISKTTVLGLTSGVMLPDADAEKAKRRDATHLEQIKMSPAFISPLRNQAP